MSNTKRYRVGLVGAGHIAPYHVAALQRLSNVEIVGVADLDLGQAKRLADQFKIPQSTSDVAELLPHCDVVHVLTPPRHHAMVTIEALEANCHVFVEKPLATSVEDCDRIISVARRMNRVVGVDHSLLLDPFTLKAQRLVDDNKIGQVIAVDCIRSQDLPEYRGGSLPEYAREAGYPIRDLGIHALYQVEAFLGAIAHLEGSFANLGSNPLLPYDDWRLTARCENGTAHLHLSYSTRPLQDILVIQGTRGTITIDRFGLSVTYRRESRLPEHPQRIANGISQGLHAASQVPLNVLRTITGRIRRYHGLQAMVADFYDRLSSGRDARVPPQDARRITRWLESVAQQADEQHQRQLLNFSCDLSATTLVTGGTGLIGRALVNRLIRQGRRVRVVTRRPPSDTGWSHDDVEWVVGDLGDASVARKAMRGIDCVYHVAGCVDGSAAEYWRGNVEATRNIIRCALDERVAQMIYVSSLSVLATPASAAMALDEDSPLEPHAEWRGHYTQTKLVAENLVRDAVTRDKLPAVILRPAEVVGPGTAELSPAVGRRHGNWLVVFGNGETAVPLVHVEDVVDALIASETRRLTDGTIMHLVDPNTTSQNTLAQRYIEQRGQPLRQIHLPRALMYLLGVGVQSVFLGLRRIPPISKYRLQAALKPRRFAGVNATRLLDWQPRHSIMADNAMTAPVASQDESAKRMRAERVM